MKIEVDAGKALIAILYIFRKIKAEVRIKTDAESDKGSVQKTKSFTVGVR